MRQRFDFVNQDKNLIVVLKRLRNAIMNDAVLVNKAQVRGFGHFPFAQRDKPTQFDVGRHRVRPIEFAKAGLERFGLEDSP